MGREAEGGGFYSIINNSLDRNEDLESGGHCGSERNGRGDRGIIC